MALFTDCNNKHITQYQKGLFVLIALSLHGSNSQKNEFLNLSLKKFDKLRTPNRSHSQS